MNLIISPTCMHAWFSRTRSLAYGTSNAFLAFEGLDCHSELLPAPHKMYCSFRSKVMFLAKVVWYMKHIVP